MTSADQPSDDTPRYVVGIGASAGGLEALERFFAEVPADTGIAFVVLQHVSPDFQSHLEQLLSRCTATAVCRAEHGLQIRRNHVYLIPAQLDVRVQDNKLLLSERLPGRGNSQPIDALFTSLANDYGNKSIAVILSGTGSDGAVGVGAVYRAGGLVFAQSEESAKFPELPTRAMVTGTVQMSQAPEGIAKTIIEYAQQSLSPATFAAQELARRAEQRSERAIQLLRRKREDIIAVAQPHLAVPPEGSEPSRRPSTRRTAPRQHVDHQLLATYDRLLDRYMPPSILVGGQHEVIHAFGGAEKYLRHRGGRMTSSILDLLDDQLKISVALGLQHASQSGEAVSYPDLLFQDPQGQVRLAISIEPVPESQETIGKFLIIFKEAALSLAAGPPSQRLSLEEVTRQHIAKLETVLQSTHANLQATIEELEASNEELLASNEELVASNQQLQNTNEELHNANKQLYELTVEGQMRIPGLAEAAGDLDQLLATARVGIIFLDEELRVRRFTTEIARVFRLLPQDLGRSVATFAHALAHPSLVSDLQEVLLSRQEKELEVTSAQGEPYLLRVLPYRNGGRMGGLVMALVDIEHLRRADHELVLRHRAIHAAASGVMIIDAVAEELPIVYVNEGFERLTGFTSRSVVGTSCKFLQGPDTDQRSVAAIQEAISQRHGCRVTLLNYKKNGQTFWNDLQLDPIADDSGAATQFVALLHDVSEFVTRERALHESEQDFRGTYENAAVGIAQLDARGRWVRVNSRLCEIVGYNQDELTGMTFHQLTDPEDIGTDAGKFDSLIRGESTGYRCESRYHHRDGRVVWVLLSTSPRLTEDGQVAGCIAVIQDISERKQTELALQKARRMADSANRAKSNFVANMSHELRTPTTAILGFADMLADELSNADQLQKVQTLKRNGEYLLRLLDDIVDLSKIESRRIKVDTEPCDFMALIDEVEVLMRGRAGQGDSLLSFHYPTLLPKIIYTSSTRIRRILVNLIANAFKGPVGGEVAVTIVYREDRCGVTESQPCLEFEVAETAADGAAGVDQRCFIPLLQADAQFTQRFADRESGLSITKRLVAALGGTIEVAGDHQEGGNAFRVRLPIGEASDLELTTRAGRASDAKSGAGGGRLHCIEGKILVADDRRDIWQVTKYFLQRCGAEVAVAEDGRQAVDAVRAAEQQGQPFDLLLLDMQMPVMNGLDAVKELRDAGFSLPIVALTADAMKGERQRCIAAGCNDYLTKPIDVMLLTQTVIKHLGDKA